MNEETMDLAAIKPVQPDIFGHKKILLPHIDGFFIVNLHDIVRCQADSSYIKFVLRNNQLIVVSRTLKDFEQQLPASQFARVHKSHLVNIACIVRFTNRNGYSITLENNDIVPVAKSRKDMLLEMLCR